MLNSKSFWYFNMAWVIGLWGFIIYGFISPFQNEILNMIWLTVTILTIVIHIIELPKSIPIGKNAGISLSRTIIKTLIFGLIWWVPLKRGVIEK